jgi:hypothetical protein
MAANSFHHQGKHVIPLPDTSFISFTAQRATKARLVWKNRTSARAASIERHAYFLPLPGDPGDSSDEGDTMRFLAERYGGEGIGVNGGGARCGLRDGLQIKGIGPNILAGGKQAYWHAYGGESLAGSIREAIWGEICHAVLPHGAVRVLGVIDTGTLVSLHAATPSRAGGMTRRGLTIREAALRPGHYMRALGYLRADEKLHGIGSDAERTRRAVNALPHALRAQYAIDRSLSEAEAINATLLDMTARFAEQQAASWAKRIVHGTISASNLATDGRAIDFGTMSTVSDFGRIIVAKGGRDAWQTSPTTDVMGELLRTLLRYLPMPDKPGLVSYAAMSAHFSQVWENSRKTEFLKLTGLPSSFIAQSGRNAVDALSACIDRIVASGNGEPFRLYSACPGAGAAMPHKMGNYRLNDILTTLALHEDDDAADRAVSSHLQDGALRTRLIKAYFPVRRAYLSQLSQEQRAAAWFTLALDAVRLNQNLPGLYRHHLDQSIDALVAGGGDVQGFSDAIIGHAIAMLGQRNAHAGALRRVGANSVSVPILLEGVRQAPGASMEVTIDIDALILSADETALLRILCKKAF